MWALVEPGEVVPLDVAEVRVVLVQSVAQLEVVDIDIPEGLGLHKLDSPWSPDHGESLRILLATLLES